MNGDETNRDEMAGDALTITLPVEGYERVVRLVTGGLASRLGFGFETVDDLQLAIELVLRAVPDRQQAATVHMASDGRTLTIAIGPIGSLALDQPLGPLDGAGVELGGALSHLVDSVELRADTDVAVLTTALPQPA